MRIAIATAAALFLLACGGTDISDNDPITPGQLPDSGTTPTGDGGKTADASLSVPDAATIDPAANFCARYDQLCGFGTKMNYFADEQTCLSTFNGFDAPTQICVVSELNLLEGDGDAKHCSRATGAGQPCG